MKDLYNIITNYDKYTEEDIENVYRENFDQDPLILYYKRKSENVCGW